MRLSKCKSCGAAIVFIPTPGGKSMPCDAALVFYKLNAKGKDKIVTRNGEVLTGKVLKESMPDFGKADGVGYVPHWGSCPNADKFRKGGKK